MEYKGKLYGKIGNKYFDTSHTAEDWDKLTDRIKELEQQLQVSKLPMHGVISCPNCESTNVVEFLNRGKRQCQICGENWRG